MRWPRGSVAASPRVHRSSSIPISTDALHGSCISTVIPGNVGGSKEAMVKRGAISLVTCGLAILAACTSTSAEGSSPASTSTALAPSEVSPSQADELEGRIAFGGESDEGSEFFIVDLDGSEPERLPLGSDAGIGSASPDGTRLSVGQPSRDGSLLVSGNIRTDGTGLHLFGGPDPTLSLACGVWSPDGRHLACEGWDDSDPARDGVYVVRAADGGDPQRLTEHRDYPCDYSPDGTQITFVRVGTDTANGTLHEPKSHLMAMDVDGSGAHRLLGDPVGFACDWSPDGRSMLTEFSGTVSIVTPDGTSTPIPLEGYATRGVWSPDGTRIAFGMSLELDHFDVYVSTPQGSEAVQITSSPLLEEPTAWMP